MRIYRPLQLSFNHQVLEQNRQFYFTASATLGIDLKTGEELLDLNYLKDVFEGMGINTLPDMGMPKPKGEFFVSGSFFAPNSRAVTGGEVEIRIGEIRKKLLIFGPRKWQSGLPSEPEEIISMPLDFTKAFGGEGYEKNPDGIGFNDGLLPCIENPKNIVASKNDKPEPAAFSPLYPTLPQRMKYQGTYDSDYKEKYFPGYPEDHNWKYFMCGHPDQWVKEFFEGDESFCLYNMHPEFSKIEGNLPGFVARCFINQTKEDKEIFAELMLNLDTIWFFPEKMLALIVFRGVTEVEDDEAEAISDVICAYEDKLKPARSTEYYKKAFEKRKHSDDELLKNLNTQDLIPDGHKCAMELLMDRALGGEEEGEKNALIKNMGAKAEAIKEKTDKDIEEAIKQTEDNIEGINIKDKGKIDIQKLINESQDTKLDPDVEKLNQKLEAILPGITANDPKKIDLKNFSFDKIDELTDAVDEFSEKKENVAKGIANKEIQKSKEQVGEQIKNIDKQIENLKKKAAKEDLTQIGSLENTKAQLSESLKPFDDIDIDGKSKTKDPLPRIDIDKIKAQTEQINPQMMQAMQHLQLMKDSGVEGEKIIEMEKQIQDIMANTSKDVEEALKKAEKGFKEGYIISAHFMEEGLSPHTDSVEDVKKSFIDAVSKGEDVSGKDWACIDLKGVNLDGIDLSGAFLEQVDLTGASLKGANLSKAILAKAILDDADLTGTNLEEANVGAVHAHGTNFTNASLKSAKLSKGDFTEADFTEANLEEIETLEIVIEQANFTNAQMQKIYFIETKISGTKFNNADINSSSFVNCDIDEGDFSSSIMNSCSFVGSTVKNSSFEKADLSKACFVATKDGKSSMVNLKFKRACLKQANFQDMSMQNTDLTYADIQNTYFGGTDLSNSDLSNALAKETQFRKAILTGAKMDGINLERGSLAKANLVGASFKKANLHGVDFLRSTITNTDFSDSNLDWTLIENWRPE